MNRDQRGQCLVGKSILVIDDSPDIGLLYRRVLQHEGAVVDTAAGALAGIAKALSQAYDLVLMDLEMPEVSGMEGVARLRSQGYDGLVVALTAHVVEDKLSEGMANGFNGVIAKGGDWSGVVAAIQALVQKTPTGL